MAAGQWNTGAEGLGQFPEMEFQYNAYGLPGGVELYPDDRMRPITATGCLDSSQFKQPNTTYYAFCSLVETYLRQPPNNTNPLITSLTNVTRYSGVIGVRNNETVKTAYGIGYPIVFMEGEVQVSTNAGALVYPPLGLFANPFFYRTKNTLFPNASDLLYPGQIPPIDGSGIVVTTLRNQTNLFMTNVSDDQTIGQRGAGGVIHTYFSLFEIFPAEDLETVMTQCNVPPGYNYYPTDFQCDTDAAPVSFGDVDLNDVDPVEDETYYDFLPPNMISFRFFTAWTPNTTIYQLSYFTYANPVAIVHMRMGLFTTNTSYVDSFSALPQYQLLEETEEIELVNVDDTMIINNLKNPVKLIQNKTYAIGVWADSLVYGPQARWGVDAAGAPLPYNLIDIDGDFPKQILALGGQTGTQPMAAVGCVAKERLLQFEWCATFADYYEILGTWYLERRFYSGVLWGLSTPYQNDWGTYHILTAGNGTFWTVTVVVPPPPAGHAAWSNSEFNLNRTVTGAGRRGLGAARNSSAIWSAEQLTYRDSHCSRLLVAIRCVAYLLCFRVCLCASRCVSCQELEQLPGSESGLSVHVVQVGQLLRHQRHPNHHQRPRRKLRDHLGRHHQLKQTARLTRVLLPGECGGDLPGRVRSSIQQRCGDARRAEPEGATAHLPAAGGAVGLGVHR